MITCLGLVVGMIESAYIQDVLNQCAKWLKQHMYLLDCNEITFVIDGIVYATVLDVNKEEFSILCRMYDGYTKIGVAQ